MKKATETVTVRKKRRSYHPKVVVLAVTKRQQQRAAWCWSGTVVTDEVVVVLGASVNAREGVSSGVVDARLSGVVERSGAADSGETTELRRGAV